MRDLVLVRSRALVLCVVDISLTVALWFGFALAEGGRSPTGARAKIDQVSQRLGSLRSSGVRRGASYPSNDADPISCQ